MLGIVKEITAEDTYPLRSRVLRPNLPIQSCHFEGDRVETTFHLGLFVNTELICIASFQLENNSLFQASPQYRLRGMATDPTYQGSGHGSTLLTESIDYLKARQCQLVWCNARIKAVEFYERAGFTKQSEIFQIEGVGPHYLMKKQI